MLDHVHILFANGPGELKIWSSSVLWPLVSGMGGGYIFALTKPKPRRSHANVTSAMFTNTQLPKENNGNSAILHSRAREKNPD